MNNKILEGLQKKLLDLSKMNNLISFRNTKKTTAEIVFPDIEQLFSKIEGSSKEPKETYN